LRVSDIAVKKHPTPPVVGRGRGNVDKSMKEWRDLIRQILSPIVPELPGWYAWICMDKNYSMNPYLYIGQSQTRNTSSLYARLKEEIGDEWIVFWATVHGKHLLDEEIKRNQRYETGYLRVGKKIGVTHIIWCGQDGFADDQLTYVERQLIDRFLPSANSQKPMSRGEYPQMSSEVIRAFVDQVRQLRGD
jgi:hypothetical protein